MTASHDDTVRFAHCSRCGGEWVCQDGLQAAVSAQTPPVVPSGGPSVRTLRASDLTVRYRGCPVCGEPMNRRQFMVGSGVILDECRGHGVWLDSEEREQILQFVRSGDAVRRQQQMAVDAESARRAKRGNIEIPSVLGPNSLLLDATLGGSDELLYFGLCLVARAVRAFLGYL
jgi:Zn-finger nucleic acid-binding protein